MTRRNVPARSAGAASSSSAYGRALLNSTCATFSNADATMGTTDAVALQTGTMSAARTVTLPAASAVSAGRDVLISDLSGTVTLANRIIVAPAGSDTIPAGYPHIVFAGGWLRLVSDGSSKWIVTASSSPDLLWAARGTTDLGTKSADASAVATSSWAAALSGDAIVHPGAYTFSTTGGAATRMSMWPLNGSTGLTMPASKRFVLEYIQGPRNAGGATYGANIVPIVACLYQDVTHLVGVHRQSATPTNMEWIARDASSTSTITSTSAVMGYNEDVGAHITVEVQYKDPVAATSDPEAYITASSRAGATIATQQGKFDDTMSGGAPDSTWRSGGNLTVAVGCAETGAGAGTSYIAGLIMRKHPLDR